MKELFEINSQDELEYVIKRNNGLLLLFFTSPTCGPCVMMEPVLDEVVQENLASVATINTHENIDLVRQFNIKATPTVFIVKDQEIKEQVIGYQNLEVWKEILSKI